MYIIVQNGRYGAKIEALCLMSKMLELVRFHLSILTALGLRETPFTEPSASVSWRQAKMVVLATLEAMVRSQLALPPLAQTMVEVRACYRLPP